MIDASIKLIIILILAAIGIVLYSAYKRKDRYINNETSHSEFDDLKDVSETEIAKKTNSYLKIYASKVPNTRISLERKVPVSEFNGYVNGGRQKHILLELGYVYMWDFGVHASKHLNEGDAIWILTGDKLYETELHFIITDEKGDIGDAIGWARQFGGAWKNVAIIKSCIKHDKIPHWINRYSKGEKNSIAKNFYKLN